MNWIEFWLVFRMTCFLIAEFPTRQLATDLRFICFSVDILHTSVHYQAAWYCAYVDEIMCKGTFLMKEDKL